MGRPDGVGDLGVERWANSMIGGRLLHFTAAGSRGIAVYFIVDVLTGECVL